MLFIAGQCCLGTTVSCILLASSIYGIGCFWLFLAQQGRPLHTCTISCYPQINYTMICLFFKNRNSSENNQKIPEFICPWSPVAGRSDHCELEGGDNFVSQSQPSLQPGKVHGLICRRGQVGNYLQSLQGVPLQAFSKNCLNLVKG